MKLLGAHVMTRRETIPTEPQDTEAVLASVYFHSSLTYGLGWDGPACTKGNMSSLANRKVPSAKTAVLK